MMDGVPTFYLYGEPHRTAAENFVHVEPLDDRSRPSEWTIKPHSHADLAQIFVVDDGGGTMMIEDRRLAFAAPCLILVPARYAHGFEWLQETAGSVITISIRYLAELGQRDAAISSLLLEPAVLPLPSDDNLAIRSTVSDLMRELGWSAPGHRAAVDALLLLIMIRALRTVRTLAAREEPRGRQTALVARLRARIEDRYRHREPVSDLAAALGVSETTLRSACARIAGRSPTAILDERALLEAKRLLLYSNLTIAEIGYTLGFPDPAYFSRFFARHAGHPPIRYRRSARREL